MERLPSIYHAARSCRSALERCQSIKQLTTNDWAENRLADFNLWASGTGALQPASKKTSLDARLAPRASVCRIIVKILQLLHMLLEECERLGNVDNDDTNHAAIYTGRHDSNESSETGAQDSFALWSDSDDTASSSDAEVSGTQPPFTPLARAMKDVDLQLEQLACIGLTIRQVGGRSRLQRADRGFDPADHKDLHSYLMALLRTKWAIQEDKLCTPPVLLEHPPPLTTQSGMGYLRLSTHRTALNPQVSEVQARLIRCNLLRRNRFIYAQKHARALEPHKPPEREISETHDLEPAAEPARPKDEVRIPDASPEMVQQPPDSGDQELPKNPSPEPLPDTKGPKTIRSTNTGTFVSSVSKLSASDLTPKVSYSPSTVASRTVLNVDYPSPPEVQDSAIVFKCPCCCQTLPVKYLEKSRWRKHLSKDLWPYTCVLQGCSMPDTLYLTRKSWEQHMSTNHAATEHWCCFACLNNPNFTTEELLVQHLRSAHQDTITSSQISGLKSASKVLIQDKITSCPICDWPHGDTTIGHDELMSHIAKDVHDFSLRALPWAGDEAKAYCNTATKQAAIQDWVLSLPQGHSNTWWGNGTTAIFSSKWYKSVASYQSSSQVTTIDTREAFDTQETDREPNYFDDIMNPYFSQQPVSITGSEAASDNTAVKALKSMRQEQDKHSNDGDSEPVKLGEGPAVNQKPVDLILPERSNGDLLFGQLRRGTTPCFPDGDVYISLDVLNRVMTFDSITESLGIGPRLRAYHGWDELPREILLNAVKLFAILVLIDKKPAIVYLMEDGLTDKELPLCRRNNTDFLVSKTTGREFPRFEEKWSTADVDAFVEKQWYVLAPIFEHVGQHLVLDADCRLPLLWRGARISGGLGFQIYEAQFDQAHCSESFAMTTDGFVAVLGPLVKEDFVARKDNLDTISKISHQHLIRFLATVERGSDHYIIFPWAHGRDLKHFWQHYGSNAQTSVDPELVMWSLEQMIGLTDGVKRLHDTGLFHGQITPRHVLHFTDPWDSDNAHPTELEDPYPNRLGVLVLTSFWVPRAYNHMNLQPRHWATAASAPDTSYEAPEAGNDRRNGISTSPPANIWSLGCVFLEFIVWLLYGFHAVEVFRLRRIHRDTSRAPGSFFTQEFLEHPSVHSRVTSAIRTLREDPRCSDGTALGELVELIEHGLLVIDPSCRVDAAILHENLQEIFERAQDNPSYLCPTVLPTPETPKLFANTGNI